MKKGFKATVFVVANQPLSRQSCEIFLDMSSGDMLHGICKDCENKSDQL